MAASVTHALSSRAARRRAMRSSLHGPWPLITRLNSTQSIGQRLAPTFSSSSTFARTLSGRVTPVFAGAMDAASAQVTWVSSCNM